MSEINTPLVTGRVPGHPTCEIHNIRGTIFQHSITLIQKQSLIQPTTRYREEQRRLAVGAPVRLQTTDMA